MNWLTWRQHRPQAVAGYGALAVIGAFLILTGLQILHAYDVLGLSRCLNVLNQDCSDLASQFSHRFTNMQFFVLFALLIPVLMGMFWGAPLIARELEHGTHRLVWTQSVTRKRWVVSKLSIVGGSALAFSAILAVLVNWWSEPLAKTGWDRFGPGIFDLRGFVPIAYTIFAVALGVAIGTLTRKTLPALFATLAVFGAVRIAVILFLREHYMAAKVAVYAFGSDAPVHARGDWLLSQETIDRAGTVVSEYGGLSYEYISRSCPNALAQGGGFPDKEALLECVRISGGFRTREVFHPANRFWTFQAIEAAIFIALTALLVAFIIRRVKRLS